MEDASDEPVVVGLQRTLIRIVATRSHVLLTSKIALRKLTHKFNGPGELKKKKIKNKKRERERESYLQ